VVELEALGYVVREADPEDTRIRRVALTTKGRSVIERGRAARSKLEAELLSEVGPKAMAGARKVLVALLKKTGGLEAVAQRRVKLPSR
jgi:DNA-binding MarR family transcriptional regulator